MLKIIIVVNIPSDFGVIADSFEVRNGKIYKIPKVTHNTPFLMGTDYHGNKIMGSSTSIKNVALSSSISTRLFVLANNNEVQKDVQSKL